MWQGKNEICAYCICDVRYQSRGTLIFSFLPTNALFQFRISVQFTLHMFRPWLGHLQGYIDKFTSLFTGQFGIITETLHNWTVKWTYQCTPEDGRVTAETYELYRNTKIKMHWLVKNWKLMSRCTVNTTWSEGGTCHLKYMDIGLSDNSHHCFAQTALCVSRQGTARRCFSLAAVSADAFQFDVLQATLCFC
jgi:hypothetical protein